MAALDFPDNPAVGETFTSGNVLWTWDGTSWSISGTTVTSTKLRYSTVGISTTISVPNTTNVIVTFDTVLGGEDWRQSGNQALIAPTTGLYAITSAVEYTPSFAAGDTRIRNVITISGTTVTSFAADNVTGGGSGYTGGFSKTVFVPLVAGDIINCTVWHNNGATRTLNSKTNLSMVLMDSDLSVQPSTISGTFQPTIFRYANLTGIASTRVPLSFTEQFGPDLVPGERYIVEMQASWRFGTGATSSVVFYGMDGANQIAYIQRYGAFGSNERGDGSVSFVYTWVGPDPIPIMEASTSASTMQSNASTGRSNIIKFTPYPG